MPVRLTRERRKELTREHLLRAAADVFAREGFSGASLDAVAEAAGFTKGAVYSNFAGKDDLFLALLDLRMEEQLAAFGHALRTPGTHEERVAELARTMSEMVVESQGWMRLNLEFTMYALRRPDALAKVRRSQRARHRLFTAFVEEELRREGLDRVPAAYVVELLSSVVDGIGLARLVDADQVPDDLLAFALQVISKGLRA